MTFLIVSQALIAGAGVVMVATAVVDEWRTVRAARGGAS